MRTLKLPTVLPFLVSLMLAIPAYGITKCQDSDGQWHYGDTAVAACKNSKLTTLTERGFVKDVYPPPKTNEQLRAEQDQLDQAEREAKLKKERERILGVYESVEAIDQLRDKQVRSVQSNIDVHETYLSTMKKRIEQYRASLGNVKSDEEKMSIEDDIRRASSRIESYTKQLSSLELEKIKIAERFARERETYLSLTGGALNSASPLPESASD